MLITTRQKHQLAPLTLEITLDSVPIQQVNEHRVLGVVLDSEMNWQAHLSSLFKILSRNLFLMSQLKKFTDVSTLKLYYYAHIMPHINFASTLWDGCSDACMKKLRSLHRRAIKLILPDSTIPTDIKHQLLNILPLHQQLEFNKAVWMFKIYHGEAPPYLESLIRKATDRYGSDKLIPPLPRIDLYKTSFAFSGSLIWNSLPRSLKHISTAKAFKRELRKHLIYTQSNS